MLKDYKEIILIMVTATMKCLIIYKIVRKKQVKLIKLIKFYDYYKI